MDDGEYIDGSVWFYAPNKGAPVFFAVAFLLSGAVHLWQTLPLYELGNYYVLGRILYFVPYHSPIHPGRVLTTFAAISMVIEALNGNGVKAALLLQIIVVVLFVSLATHFQVKCRRNGINSTKVNNALTTLHISTAIITVRTIYRIIEYFDLSNMNFWAPGFDPMSMSPIIRYEWFFYVFEASLMLINSVMLNVRHPRRWLPKSTKVYLAKDGATEVIGPGYKQERNFFVTLLDPFDIYGMMKGKDKETRFWDTDGVGEAKSNSHSAPTTSVTDGTV